MNWLPTGDQVLLKLQEKTDKTTSGIIIMSGTDDYRYANVIKTGPGLFTATGDRIPMTVKEDQEVMIHSNQIGDHKEVTIDGEKYQLVRESEIALIKQ
jgi:co-chaperonin GroES (HSP10)